jgi:hypothetical protein
VSHKLGVKRRQLSIQTEIQTVNQRLTTTRDIPTVLSDCAPQFQAANLSVQER